MFVSSSERGKQVVAGTPAAGEGIERRNIALRFIAQPSITQYAVDENVLCRLVAAVDGHRRGLRLAVAAVRTQGAFVDRKAHAGAQHKIVNVTTIDPEADAIGAELDAVAAVLVARAEAYAAANPDIGSFRQRAIPFNA